MLLFVVSDSDAIIYGVFTSRQKADECVALVYKYQGIDPEQEFFGWWVTVEEFVQDEPIGKLLPHEDPK